MEPEANGQRAVTRGEAASDSLVVCVAERGEVSVFLCKVHQPVDDSGQLWKPKQERGTESLHNTLSARAALAWLMSIFCDKTLCKPR